MTIWRLRDPSSLHAASWDDGVVLFHAPSGDTHLLERPMGEALLLLREGPRDPSRLACDVASRLACDAGQLAAALTDVLARLEELGVVEVHAP